MQLTGGQLDSMTPLPSLDGKKLYVVGQKLRGETVRWDAKSAPMGSVSFWAFGGVLCLLARWAVGSLR